MPSAPLAGILIAMTSLLRSSLFLTLGLACVVVAACGGSVVFVEDGGDGGQGGQGGTTTVVTSTTTTTKSSSVVTSSTVGPTTTNSVSTGPSGCDTGVQASIDSFECQDCQACTFAPGGQCEDELFTCQNGTCYSYIDCVSSCSVPNCEQACQNMYPQGAAEYQALFECVVCVDCFNNCEGFNYCFFE